MCVCGMASVPLLANGRRRDVSAKAIDPDISKEAVAFLRFPACTLVRQPITESTMKCSRVLGRRPVRAVGHGEGLPSPGFTTTAGNGIGLGLPGCRMAMISSKEQRPLAGIAGSMSMSLRVCKSRSSEGVVACFRRDSSQHALIDPFEGRP
jgi:hypothetical protein